MSIMTWEEYHKKNLSSAIELIEKISHYEIGSNSFKYDIFNFIPCLRFQSYRKIFKEAAFFYGLTKDQVDRLICINDVSMRWERKDKLLKVLKEYLNGIM